MCKFEETTITLKSGEKRRALKIWPRGKCMIVDPVRIYNEPSQEFLDKICTYWVGNSRYYDYKREVAYIRARADAINYLDRLKRLRKLEDLGKPLT